MDESKMVKIKIDGVGRGTFFVDGLDMAKHGTGTLIGFDLHSRAGDMPRLDLIYISKTSTDIEAQARVKIVLDDKESRNRA